MGIFRKRQSNVALEQILKIESYFKKEKLLTFLKNYENIISKNKSNQNFTYFGVNFMNGKVDSVKFYAHVFEQMSIPEIKQFVPTSDDYTEFLDLRNKGLNVNKNSAGVALELKYKADSEEPRYGFFYHLNNVEESYDRIGFPEELSQHMKNNCAGLGINFEYHESLLTFKKYYYFKDSTSKTELESKFGIRLLKNATLLEYAKSGSMAKMNAYKSELPELLKRGSIFTKDERSIISYFNNKYKLVNLGCGVYQDKKIKSIYFRDASNKVSSEYNNMDTLKKIISGQSFAS
jgi:hypothetical protein